MSEFELLGPDDVVRLEIRGFALVKHSPFLGNQFTVALQNLLATENASGLISGGIPCQVLKPGENWQKGKLHIRVEFVPDEPQVKKVIDAPDLLNEFRQ